MRRARDAELAARTEAAVADGGRVAMRAAINRIIAVPDPFDLATDMRRSSNGLSLMAEQVLKQDPDSGHLFCFSIVDSNTAASCSGTAAAL